MPKVRFLISIFLTIIIGIGRASGGNAPLAMQLLESELQSIADSCKGEVGIAVITDRGDTIAINNDVHYPMMSVFKLHQAVATCRFMERTGVSLDSVVTIPREALNPDTWSPMLKDNPADTLRLSYHGLFQYTLRQSDNNASNYIFETVQDPESVYTAISQLIPPHGFNISHTEAAMQADHSLADENFSTPLSATELINLLFTDYRLLQSPAMDFVRQTLSECATGVDRISEPLQNEKGVKIAHKTGSGYVENGVLMAHNDVAFICLPSGRHYSLAVFVKNFNGSGAAASRVISQISRLVYTAMLTYPSGQDSRL